MTDSMKCQICQKQYTVFQSNHNLNYQELPLLLICGHSFCQKCLTNIYKKQEGLFCPACGVHTECWFDKKTGIKGLYPHMSALGCSALSGINVSDKAEILKDCSNKKKYLQRNLLVQQCSECVDRVATVTCMQCGVNICDECFHTIHKNFKALKRHQAIPISRSAHSLALLDCSKHHSFTNFYCIDDSSLICRECIYEDHHEHKIISLHEKSEQLAPQVKESLEKANIIKYKLQNYISQIEEELDQVLNEIKMKENEIVSYFLEVTGKMQSNFLMLMDDLEKLSYAEIKQLVQMKDNACKELARLQVLCGDAELVVNSSKEIELLAVNPIETLNSLKQAEKFLCILKKVSLNDGDSESNEDSDRFLLHVNQSIMSDVKDWALLEDNRKFMYESKPCDNFDNEILPSLDSSDTASSASILKDESANKEEKTKLRVVQIPPAQNQELVFVSLVSNPEDFYVQRHNDRSQLATIERKLKIFSFQSCSEDHLSSLCLGEFCAVTTGNKKWCRAKVTKIIKAFDACTQRGVESFVAHENEEVELFLIDYGKTTRKQVSCLRALPQTLHHIPPLALPCSLVGVQPTGSNGSWSEKANQMFAKVVSNRPVLMTTVKRDSGRRFVDLHKPAPDEIDRDVPVSVRDALVFMKFAKFNGKIGPNEVESRGKIKQREFFRPALISVRSCVNVVLSHYQSISRFFVQHLGSNATYLENLTEKIQKFVVEKISKDEFDPASPFSVLKPFVDMPCLAKYECCHMWFRAKVLKVLEENSKVQVFYVDYGNEAEVDYKDLLKIPDEFMKLAYQGLECRLADITPSDHSGEWGKESSERFFELVGEDQLKMMVRSYENNVYNVELFDWTDSCRVAANELSINERLVHEGLALGLTVHKVVSKNPTSSPPAEDIDDEVDDETSSESQQVPVSCVSSKVDPTTSEVTVVECLSPALFYTQTELQWQACNELTQGLNNALREQVELQDMWKVGDECAVYSTTEKRWCRGVVSKMKGKEHVYVVHLVDFGLTEDAHLHSLCVLPDQFKEDTPHCTACYIADIQPAGGKKWSFTALDIFKDMVRKKKCSMVSVGEESEGGSLPVKLFVSSSIDDQVEVGRELILRGVALPVFRLDFLKSDSAHPHTLNKIQMEFERSEAAYQQAENLKPSECKTSKSPLPPDVTVPDPFQQVVSSISFFKESNKTTSDFPRSDDTNPLSVNAPSSALSAPIKTVPSRIPDSDALTSSSSFECVVSHIEKYNLFYIQKIPVKRVLPKGEDLTLNLPELDRFDPGTPCLARFDDDNQWYRAEVISRHNNTVSVYFVDYGLSQTVKDTKRILILPEKYLVAPRKAIACHLPSMPSIIEASLPEDRYMSLVADLIGKKRFLCSVIKTEAGKPPSINLLEEKKNIAFADLFVESLALLDYQRF